MKTILIQLSLLALVVGGLGCKKTEPDQGGNPQPAYISYDLVDGAGTASWFALPASTPPDSVRLQATYANGTTQRYQPVLFPARGRVYLKDVGYGFSSSNLVQTSDHNGRLFTSTQYLLLNRLDVDTLRTELLLENVPNSEVINQIRFYYNNRLSASYDLRANPGINDSLFNNSPVGLVVPLHKYRHRQ